MALYFPHIQVHWRSALNRIVSPLQSHCTHHPNPLPHPPTQTVRYESSAHDPSPNVGIMGAMGVNSQHLAICSAIKGRSQASLQKPNAPAVVLFLLAQQHEISMWLRGNARVEESLLQNSVPDLYLSKYNTQSSSRLNGYVRAIKSPEV
ncbi:uncharacterized protein ACLA_089500 [Aspergillus clavatus NRRL 1]|uniref:Uncharacterized protein n=1 Tax=Aspergillus clavatus (strain ATCC 1007 / CBS 513.65 / DSM 816 / NCTC 3887 / NRRL 1 / QM 1276 / 107) TaxID=344612 RepID=A1CEF9_ASPCL|nr:uncharacterized protein ACLA_089500 [Aspergillus clavatus NRRL 1]EAW11258.1 hypothetical protein ACLA_089500 [Aspergillus clavatus NRRL 1]